MTDYESYEDEDSFLDQVASLDIRTPPHSPHGIMKGISPLHSIELHPQACLCQVCTNPLSLLHTAKLVVQCCDVALMQTKDELGKVISSEDDVTSAILTRVHLSASAIVSLKEMVKKRIDKCNKALQNISIPGAEPPNQSTKNKAKAKVSSRSTKSTSRRTKKSSKSPLVCSSEPQQCSVAKATEFQCAVASMAITRSECSLIMERPREAMEELESALSQLGGGGGDHTDKELCLSLARLHYQMGVACMQEMELSQPSVAMRLWEESVISKKTERTRDREEDDSSLDPGSTVTKSRSKPSRKTATRRTRTNTTKSSSANKGLSQDSMKGAFSHCLNHFLIAYQLCFPSVPAIMTREVSQWVGVLVRGGDGAEEPAAHFINVGMNCTLTHQTIYCLGKKIRSVCS